MKPVPPRGRRFAITLLLIAFVVGGFSRVVADEPYGRHQFDESERDHWAFLPVVRPEVPRPRRSDWMRTPIDAFILDKLEAEGFEPSPPADRATLCRRVYLDLTGLPPTLLEQQKFLADSSPDAFARVVDDLLSRPEYGERWGRHWLDVVRYAESNGYERDGAKPNAWRYRDWVIDAFNEDKPYDQFVLEQIAGDEIDASNARSQIATTFLRLGPWDDEPADPVVDRYDQLDDVLGTTVASFLALTLRCARCHDHKYEPFKQQDYARLLAVFEPLKRPQNGRTDLDRMVGTKEELNHFRQAVAEIDGRVAQLTQQSDQIKAEVQKRLFDSKQTSLAPDAVAAFQTAPDKRNESQKKLVQDHSAKLAEEIMAMASQEERQQLEQWQQEAQQALAAKPAEPSHAYIWYEDSPEAPLAHVFRRGDPHAPQEEIAPGLPAVLVEAPPESPVPTDHSTGRRLQLARWIASPANPLTARVIVNRIWQHHFGEGIVSTENDFGVMGEAPSHPELLDWLATELIAGGWRIKPLHRMILLSNCYQQSAVGSPTLEQDKQQKGGSLARDPENRLLWRWLPRRLEAEVVRDSILAVSGQLNHERGGPSILPKISEAVLAGQSIPGNGWKATEGPGVNRRSIYVFVKRTLPLPELETLDFPNTNASCEQRVVSTVAPQALTYMNGEFIQEQARHLAERLLREAGSEAPAQIDLAFALALCRPAKDTERAAALEFLARQAEQIARDLPESQSTDAGRKALEAFCLVLLSTNEFVYLQ